MGYLKDYYEQLAAIPESDWHFIASCFRRRVFQRGEDIIKLSEQEENLYFIETGMARYYIPREDDELTFNFSFEKEFTGAYDSFLSQTPSEYSVQALAKTVSWQISYASLQDIYDHTRVGNYLGRLFTERLLVMKAQRELSLVSHSAKDRYLNLFSRQPQILKHVPLKYVASYIGITPQALSRVRKQIC